MPRTAFLTLFVCGAIYAASPRPEASTYVDGNVSSLKPHTGGTLVFTDDHSMTFRTGLAEVAVPYSKILRAELGATQTHTHDAPAYQVWKRLHKTETQLLTVEFKNGSGSNQTMTLELSRPAASSVLATIEEKTHPSDSAKIAKADSSKDEWWGDSYWKTHRNEAKWDAEANAASK